MSTTSMPVQRTRFSQNAYLAITDYLLNELNSRFSLDATAVMEGIQSLNPRSKAFLDMTTLQEMPLKYDKHVSSDDLVPVASEAICKWGAECRRKAPAEIFLMCPLTFLLCPPHEGAQRLFVTD